MRGSRSRPRPPDRPRPRTASSRRALLAALALAAEPARRPADPDPERDHLDHGTGDRPPPPPRDPPPAAYDLAGRLEQDVDAIELAVRALERGLHLAQQRHGLLAHHVDQHLAALEHAERVDQDDAQEKDEQPPERGEHDQGDVSSVERCDQAHVAALPSASWRASWPDSWPARRRAPGSRIIPGAPRRPFRPGSRVQPRPAGRPPRPPRTARSSGPPRTAPAGTPARPGVPGTRAGTCSPCRTRASSNPGARAP